MASLKETIASETVETMRDIDKIVSQFADDSLTVPAR